MEQRVKNHENIVIKRYETLDSGKLVAIPYLGASHGEEFVLYCKKKGIASNTPIWRYNASV